MDFIFKHHWLFEIAAHPPIMWPLDWVYEAVMDDLIW